MLSVFKMLWGGGTGLCARVVRVYVSVRECVSQRIVWQMVFKMVERCLYDLV